MNTLRPARSILATSLLLLVANCASAEQLAASSSAADAQHVDALARLRNEARSLEHGEGVAKDPLRAADLYCEGARQGDAEAQYSLGWMYANGRGIPRSDAIAAYLFGKAADQGNDHAQRMLGFLRAEPPQEPECLKKMLANGDDGDLELIAPAGQEKIVGLVRKLAPEYGLSPRLVLAVILAESNFHAAAVSPKNAQGLMQLIPETSARFNVKKPFDPEQNIRGGMSYLRWLLAYFKGNVPLVAAAYNAGEGAVNRFRGVPPYPETRDYVKRIAQIFKNDEHAFDPSITEPSAELARIRVANAK